MIDNEAASDLLERAAMHEQLAATTHDPPARRMHLAMAAEYRRKAAELAGISIVRRPDPRIEMTVIAR
jgi:hypothetical protein